MAVIIDGPAATTPLQQIKLTFQTISRNFIGFLLVTSHFPKSKKKNTKPKNFFFFFFPKMESKSDITADWNWKGCRKKDGADFMICILVFCTVSPVCTSLASRTFDGIRQHWIQWPMEIYSEQVTLSLIAISSSRSYPVPDFLALASTRKCYNNGRVTQYVIGFEYLRGLSRKNPIFKGFGLGRRIYT